MTKVKLAKHFSKMDQENVQLLLDNVEAGAKIFFRPCTRKSEDAVVLEDCDEDDDEEDEVRMKLRDSSTTNKLLFVYQVLMSFVSC